MEAVWLCSGVHSTVGGKIDSNITHKLNTSIPNGVEPVLKTKGGHNDYWLYIKTDLISHIIISAGISLRVHGNPLKVLLVSYYNDFFYHVSINI